MCIELPLLQEYVWFRKILILCGMGVSESHSGGRACDRIVEVFLTPGCFFFLIPDREMFQVYLPPQKENFLLLHGCRDRTDIHSIFYLEMS